MKGRATFTKAEISRIRHLLLRVRRAERYQQKKLRAELRRIGFYIEDWSTGGPSGFTAADFDELVRTGLLTVKDESEAVTDSLSSGSPKADPSRELKTVLSSLESLATGRA